MSTFGTIKTKILKQLTEAYIAKDKEQISSIIKLMKEDSNFMELYNFYEDMENKFIDDNNTAKIYVEDLSKMLNNRAESVKVICENFDKLLPNTIIVENEIYDALDHLLGADSIRNIDTKIIAKKKITKHVTTEKIVETKKVEDYTVNESLLSTVLVNNFNSKYGEILEGEDKDEFKEIMSLSPEDIKTKIDEAKIEVEDKIKVLKEQNSTLDMTTKLDSVNDRVNEMNYSRINYYKIKQLKKDL